MDTKENMSNEEFEKAIDELSDLWKQYKTCHRSHKDRLYKKYCDKLDKLSGETHMEIEDIVLYIRN